MKRPDIDIDVKDRAAALTGHDFVPASLLESGELRKHATGVYFQRIPADPVTGLAAFPSGREADDLAGQLGFFKIDVLPNHSYRLVRDRAHMERLAGAEPDWSLFRRREVVARLYQLGNSADLCEAYEPESVDDLACLIAMIRPGKRHLIGESWETIRDQVWRPGPDGYVFKKSHAVGYALGICVQLNSMVEEGEI